MRTLPQLIVQDGGSLLSVHGGSGLPFRPALMRSWRTVSSETEVQTLSADISGPAIVVESQSKATHSSELGKKPKSRSSGNPLIEINLRAKVCGH